MSEVPAQPRPRLISRLVLAHLAVFIVVGAWMFGGQSPGARQFITAWGTVGMLLFASCAWLCRLPRGRWHPAVALLWPLGLYDLLVIVSCFNPGFRSALSNGETVLILADPLAWLPSAAVPRLAAHELWQFNGIVLSACNLLLVLPRRSQLRTFLFVLAGNTLALAVLGTFQKLTGATGLWFGAVPSPNPYFFATFIYHNHWGSFTLLSTAICLGLLFHYQRRHAGAGLWRSPFLMGVVATPLLALSVPLSASRSCTVLVFALLLVALVHFLLRLIVRRRQQGRSAAAPVAAVLVVAVLTIAAGSFLARRVIVERSRTTDQQLAQLAQEGWLTSRLVLYRDTWRMAADKPWFGWGLESYARVFTLYNTQRPAESWFETPVYAEAHNDWMQSLAEVGFVGTALLALLLALPLGSVRWRAARSALPRYLLGGCILLLLYAWLEFPFANPVVLLTFATVFYAALAYAEREADETTPNPPDA